MTKFDDALWDPARSADDAEVQRLQDALAPCGLYARGRGEWTPQAIAPPRPRRWQRFAAAALAAGLLPFALNAYRLSWQEGAAWRVRNETRATAAQIVPGQWLQAGEQESLDIAVARIGRVTLSPRSRLQLVETRGGKHRVRLESGHLRARVWAPPGHFGVESGAAQVVDMGCDFEVWRRRDGGGRVLVRSGWVKYSVAGREVLLPSGYELRFTAHRPYAPLRPATTPAFASAVLALQARMDRPDAAAELRGDAQRAAAAATDADAYTLLYLLTRRHELADTELYPRLARALSLSAGDAQHRAAWVAGDMRAINLWWDAYPTQPKRWWANWADALP
jgi:hypothetical protein